MTTCDQYLLTLVPRDTFWLEVFKVLCPFFQFSLTLNAKSLSDQDTISLIHHLEENLVLSRKFVYVVNELVDVK